MANKLPDPDPVRSDLRRPELPCACASARRAAREITQLYGEELSGYLEATQFSLLSILSSMPGCSQAVLGKAMALDKTTLSRNLRLMKDNGWIEKTPTPDRRERGLQLTAAGLERLERARPRWKQAQDRLRAAMTAEEWDTMWKAFRIVSAAAQKASQTEGKER